jgi:hypothetical protein
MLHRLLGVIALGDSDHHELLQPICASIGEPLTVSRRSSTPPPLVRKRFMEYLTVNLSQQRLRSCLLPPCCKRFKATLQQFLHFL